jgi:predicted ArsR family transcriptional regulator
MAMPVQARRGYDPRKRWRFGERNKPAIAVTGPHKMLRQQLLDTSRGRIVTLLQRGASTVDEIASDLGLTRNAVRAQITAMERDGVVERVGRRPGTTRPFHIFQLTAQVEQLLSQAYIPLLMQLVHVFANALPATQVDALMREAGRGLAGELAFPHRPAASLQSRVAAASELLNRELGAVTRVESNGGYVIRGAGCPLAALTGKHPAVCLAMESLLSEVLGVPVHECCDRTARPSCCFEIKGSSNNYQLRS